MQIEWAEFRLEDARFIESYPAYKWNIYMACCVNMHETRDDAGISVKNRLEPTWTYISYPSLLS